MNPTVTNPLEVILRLCAATAPKPWYPKRYAEEAGVPRDSLDPPLERLRLGGFIQLTDWVEGLGQGYVLTPAGRSAAQDPRELARVRFSRSSPPDGAHTRSRPREADATTFDRGEAIREALLNPPNPVIGRVVLAANVLVFLFGFYLANQRGLAADVYMHLNPVGAVPAADAQKYNDILEAEGALNGLQYINGHGWWWRLLGCCFVHIGVLHLGMNMFALYRIGPIIENMYGHVRYLVIYLLAGLGGSCFALGWNPAGAAGASGALCGIFAAEAAWVLLNRRFLPPPLIAMWRRNTLINVVLLVFISLVPGVSGMGHLGGAVVGFIVAVLLHYQRFGWGLSRWLALAGVAVLPLACVGSLAEAINVNPSWLPLREHQEMREMNEKLMPPAQRAEHAALEVYNEQVIPLVAKHPSRRDPVEVQTTIDALAKCRSELTEQAGRFAAEGPFKNPRVEEARQIRQELLEARAKLFEMTEEYLKNGENKEDALNEQEQRIKDLRARWQHHLE